MTAADETEDEAEDGEDASDDKGSPREPEGPDEDGAGSDGTYLDPIGTDTAGAAEAVLDADPEVPFLDGDTACIGGDENAPASTGRYVRARRRRPGDREGDIAVDASLRAAARRGETAIGTRDLRVKGRDSETPALVAFVVDSSMSMRAHGDIRTATDLATAVLRRANRRDEYVAVVAFRDERADEVVPPTDDPAVATDRLDDIPVGNRTPLPAGLLAAYRLVKREREAIPALPAVVVVLTDGRPTVGIAGDPVDETERLTRRLGAADVDLLVLDLDRGTSGTDICRTMAAEAGGEHVRIAEVPPPDRARLVAETIDSLRR